MDIVLNYFLAFVEGFALILSPCILPILPILLSGGIQGGKSRPLGIILGFVLTFALFTLFSRAIVQYYGLDLNFTRQLAFILIAVFGFILLSDKLSETFSLATQRIANIGANLSNKTQEGGFFSGLFLGAVVSLIWVPCGGPILATAIVQTAIQKTSLASFLTFFFFALGSVVPMIIIALIGRRVLDHFGFLKSKTELLRKIFGVIIILSAVIAEFYNPSSFFKPMPLAPNVVVESPSIDSNQLMDALSYPYPAPSIQSDGDWINSKPLTLADLKGKVVLIDFWTYSCINCVRTLPHLKNWYAKYKKKGFVIIGVHTPEFEFEKNLDNVSKAVKQYGIQYPVVLDNQYVIWSNYNNHYWPGHYLINKNGEVVYQHFGEGSYAETEHNIQVLLGLKGSKANQNTPINLDLYNETPETYLGYKRAGFSSIVRVMLRDKSSDYSYPSELKKNEWALQGAWKIQSQRITSMSANSALKINFRAAKVYVVAGTQEGKPIKVKLRLNGQALKYSEVGKDVQNGILTLKNQGLYEVLKFPSSQQGVLELVSSEPGAEFYTFTFGS